MNEMRNTEKVTTGRAMFVLAAVVLAIIAAAAVIMPGKALAANRITATSAAPTVKYSAHVADVGWMSEVSNGNTAGTTGRALRMETFKISASNLGSGSIRYQAHLSDIGWQAWKSSGQIAGTTGQKRQVEAIRVYLSGLAALRYDVLYRVHVPDMGWLAWTKNGAVAGSTGMNLRVEAMQVKIVSKGASTSGTACLTKPLLSTKAHSADIGWQSAISEGSTAGTTGRALRLEALLFNLKDFDGKTNAISARAHVSDIGWMSWVGSGKTVGTTGKGKAMEAVQIKLSGNVALFYDVYYRAHVSDYGWLGWAMNGETAGSTGLAKPMEAIQVKLIRKGTSFDRGGSSIAKPKPAVSSKTNLSYALYKNSNAFISCGFDGYRNTAGRHEGIDIKCYNGAPVYALADGVVVRVAAGRTGSSGLSTIAVYNSSYNKTIIYLHSAPSNLKAGQTIRKGQKIATESWRGISSASGSHTHVEVRNGRQSYAAKSVRDYTLDNPNPTSFWQSLGYNVK